MTALTQLENCLILVGSITTDVLEGSSVSVSIGENGMRRTDFGSLVHYTIGPATAQMLYELSRLDGQTDIPRLDLSSGTVH